MSRESLCFCNYRETFLFSQDMILLPKVYTTLPVCMLHVVNNDTMEQVPKVFQKVVPYHYTKNKVGAKCILLIRYSDSEKPVPCKIPGEGRADVLSICLKEE